MDFAGSKKSKKKLMQKEKLQAQHDEIWRKIYERQILTRLLKEHPEINFTEDSDLESLLPKILSEYL